jgi:serine/threonine-protein kinase RsbW
MPGSPDVATRSGSGTIELRLMARAENLTLVRLALAGLANAAGAPEEVVADLKLAVTEACSNAIQHAYQAGDGEDEIVVRYTIDSGVVSIDVSDTGRGFSAEGSPAEQANGDHAGLGLMIIRELTDATDVISGSSGTRVSFAKRF